MKKKVILVCILLVILLGGFAAKVFLFNNQEGSPQIEGTQTTNNLTGIKLEVFSDGVSTDAADRNNLLVGTHVKTDATGRAQIVYPNGSVTRIDKASEIILADYEATAFTVDIRLTLGRIWSRVAKLVGAESYQTETSMMVATIRGTSYGMGILADGQNKISVTKHKVDIKCHDNQNLATINTNKKIITDCKTNPKETGFNNNELDDEWFRFNLEEDKNLNARFGKETYDDEDNSPSAKNNKTITPKPTVLSASTTSPSATATASLIANQTITPTPSPTTMPTITPRPTSAPKSTAPPTLYVPNQNLQLLLPNPTQPPIR